MVRNKADNLIDDIANNCVAARLRSINRLVSGIYDAAMRLHGVTISQVNIMVVTGKLGSARPKDICSILQLDPSSLSRNVDRLLERNWLEIKREEDGRAHSLRLTDQGHTVIVQIYPDWQKAQSQIKKLLGQKETEELIAIANRVGFAKSR